MLVGLLGSENRERVLIFLHARERGYAREIARYWGISLRSVQHQCSSLETGGVLYSELVGRTRLYRFDLRWPLRKELFGLLDKALSFYGKAEREDLQNNRRRPRRQGKPLSHDC